jgi:peptide deformylase
LTHDASAECPARWRSFPSARHSITRLRVICPPVKTIDKERRTRMADMVEQGDDPPGFGLAA